MKLTFLYFFAFLCSVLFHYRLQSFRFLVLLHQLMENFEIYIHFVLQLHVILANFELFLELLHIVLIFFEHLLILVSEDWVVLTKDHHCLLSANFRWSLLLLFRTLNSHEAIHANSILDFFQLFEIQLSELFLIFFVLHYIESCFSSIGRIVWRIGI